MAADHALRREPSRRIRDDLIRLGIVSAGPAVKIADGAAASAGDLIICTKNDHCVEAGEPGRTLANGDLLRIDQVIPGRLIVRRALDADPATGTASAPSVPPRAGAHQAPFAFRHPGYIGIISNMTIIQILEITSLICTILILPIWHFFQPSCG